MRNFLFDLQRFQSSAAKYLSADNDKHTVDNSMFDNLIYDTIYALGGNDTIVVKSDSYGAVTVYGGEGNDSLVTNKAYTLLEGNEDDDTITGWNAHSSTLDGGAGDDVIESRVSYMDYDAKTLIIRGGAGADKIYSQGYQATIDGGNDNDEITNTGSNSSVNGGAGNDKITLENGSSLSIRGGTGDDTVYANNNASNLYQYSLGDGNDTIIGITDHLNYYGTNLNAFDTLAIYSTQFHDDFIVKVGSKMAGHTYTSSVVGNDLVFDIGSGAVTFKNPGKAGVNVIENDSTEFNIRIFNTANGEGIYYANDHEGAIIHGLRGNDTIKDIYATSKERKTDNIQVFGYDGDDLIENYNSFYATLDGGDGDDTIKNSCTGVKIYTGNGDNFVSNLGGQALIIGGADKDTISIGAISVTIKSGAGDDNIVNRVSDFRETHNGHCSIDAGDGNDYIYQSYNIAFDNNTPLGEDKSTLYGGAGNDTIYNDGNYNTIIGGKGDDSIVLSGALHNVIVYANGDGNDTIKGLGLNNTLLIDSDYSSVRSSNGSDIIVTVGNGKITLVDGEGTKIIKGSFTLPDDTTPPDTTPPDTTPPDTTPPDTTPPDTTPTALNLENRIASTLITATKLDDTIENYASSVTINGAEGADSITNLYIEKYDANGNFEEVWGNGDYASINSGDGDDYISNYGARATIRGGDGDDTIDNNGIIRVDDSVDDSDVNVVAVSDEFLIDGGSGNDDICNINSGATLLGGANDDYISNSGDNVSIDGGTGNDHITNYGDNLTITGGSGNDTIFNTGYSTVGKNMLIKYKSGDGDDVIYGDETATLQIGNGTTDTYSKVTVDGNLIVTVGEGKITLVDMATTVFTILGTEENSSKSTIYDNSSAAKVTLASGIEVGDASSRTTAIRIVGNELDNSIVGGSKNDTLSGGSGDDKLLGGIGNDSLSGGDGKDTLSGGSGDDKLLGGSGNDSLSGGDGKDTLSGGSGDDKLFGGSGNDSLSGGDGKDTLSGGSGDDKLLGGKGNDCIKGGTGNDSLWGDTGNDSLWGDVGKDTFIYTANEGTDKIFDYATGDMLKILNADGSDGSFKSSKFSGGDLTLTINGGGKIIFEDVASNTKFNINGSSYHISDSKLLKK